MEQNRMPGMNRLRCIYIRGEIHEIRDPQAFADCAPDLRRWTVKVTDERRRPAFTVLFPAYFAPRGWKPVLVSGARTLLMRLDAMNAVDDKSRGRIAAPRPAAFRVPTRVTSPTERRRVTASGVLPPPMSRGKDR